MSDMNPFDERLFLALETIEKLTERAEQSQATIEKLQATVTEQQRTIVVDAKNKINEVKANKEHFDNLMFNAIYQSIAKDVSPAIADVVRESLENATDESVNNLVRVIEKRTGQVKDLVRDEAGLTSRVVFDAKKELDQMTAKMKTFQNTLAKKHYLLVSQFGCGIFLFMCLFLFIFIKFGMPSTEENKRLRLENNALQSQQSALIANIQRYRGQNTN